MIHKHVLTTIASISLTVLLLSGCSGRIVEAPAQSAAEQPQAKSSQPEQAMKNPPDQQTAEAKPGGSWTPVQAEMAVAGRAQAALEAIASGDMGKLQPLVHPDRGVRFSPSAFVNVKTDRSYMPEQLKPLQKDSGSYIWGEHAGSGAPIQLTFAQYYSAYIWNHDYTKADAIGYNEWLGQGNAISNIGEVYPNAIRVDYHFNGFDKQYEGMDWSSLRLVFEQKGKEWFLVGIVHAVWTI